MDGLQKRLAEGPVSFLRDLPFNLPFNQPQPEVAQLRQKRGSAESSGTG
jgi:hypothetical protein